MSTEYNCIVLSNTNLSQLHSIVKQHVIIYPPPWSFDQVLCMFTTAQRGRPIKVVVHHLNRNVDIVEKSIANQVLQTTVQAFQRHRLAAVSPPVAYRRHSRPTVDTGQECTICLEGISSDDIHLLPCAHSFHRNCIHRWLVAHNNCPVCRLSMS